MSVSFAITVTPLLIYVALNGMAALRFVKLPLVILGSVLLARAVLEFGALVAALFALRVLKSYPQTPTADMPATIPDTRCFHLTPGHCLLALLAVEGLLFLSQWFRWLPKGWPLLIAVAAVAAMIVAMFVWFGVALVFRRRFQFSIRTLLVLTVVVALPSSWFSVDMKKAREQKAVLERFARIGGWSITTTRPRTARQEAPVTGHAKSDERVGR